MVGRKILIPFLIVILSFTFVFSFFAAIGVLHMIEYIIQELFVWVS